MFCNQFEDEGILYLYNELDGEESKKFEAHVANCSKCQMVLAQFSQARDVYRELESEAPSMWTLFLLKLKSRIFNYSTAFKKFFSKLFEPKKLWIPVSVSSIALILVCLSLVGIFNKKSNITMNPEEILEWTILSDDSINSLDQQIDEIFAENLTTNEVNKADDQMKLLFDEDLGLTELQQEIILLSWDINQSYF
jgi:hypothetical protein